AGTQRRDQRVRDRGIVAGEAFVADDRPPQEKWLPSVRDETRDALADPLAVAPRLVGQAQRATDREHAVVDELDGHAIRAEHARQSGDRAIQERSGVALGANALLQLGRGSGPGLALRGRALDPPERVLFDELERDERCEATQD